MEFDAELLDDSSAEACLREAGQCCSRSRQLLLKLTGKSRLAELGESRSQALNVGGPANWHLARRIQRLMSQLLHTRDRIQSHARDVWEIAGTKWETTRNGAACYPCGMPVS